MTISATRCPKCQGAMDNGFIVELSYGPPRVSAWTAGEPVPRLFGGIKYKFSSKRNLPIVTYRCANCGYLESYAAPSAAADAARERDR